MNTEAGTETRGGSGAMFDRIAHRYDALNRAMSFGMDRSWRRRLVASLQLPAGGRALDVATGTADVALRIAKAVPGVHVVGLDPSAGMLEVGIEKVREQGFSDRIKLVEGDARDLGFDDNSFDATCISFGIRNVPDRGRALREFARVTKPGGRVCVLELSEPQGLLAPIAGLWVHRVVPVLGAAFSGADEYDYLQKSIAAFPASAVFAQMMRDAGLEDVTVRPMQFGVVNLYVGVVGAKGAKE